eukprot:1714088-Rhodomonas_salina.1
MSGTNGGYAALCGTEMAYGGTRIGRRRTSGARLVYYAATRMVLAVLVLTGAYSGAEIREGCEWFARNTRGPPVGLKLVSCNMAYC